MPDILVFEKDITSGTLPNPIVLVVVVFPHCYDEMTTPYSQHNSRIYGKIQQSETEMTPPYSQHKSHIYGRVQKSETNLKI